MKNWLRQKEISHDDPDITYQNITYAGGLYPKYIPSPVASFGGDEQGSYLILVNGVRCSVGTRLPSGYVITELDGNGITLTRAGVIAHFPITV